MSTCVLFIQGGGEGAHAEDKLLSDSLERALGPDYDVRYPLMPDESNPSVEVWGQKISSELSKISGKVVLVAHSVGGSILLQYLSNEKFGNSIGGLFVLAAPTWDNNQWNWAPKRRYSVRGRSSRMVVRLLLHLSLGNKESHDCWQQFFRDMLSRGLRMPLLVISDGAPGLLRAIEECLPRSKRQRCLVHKLRNIANKLPQTAQEALMPKIRAVYYQTNREVAILCATQIVDEFAETYPAAIKCFQDDLENCLNHIDFPAGHHKHIRSTNLIERAFVEQKRRTKVIPRFMDEKSCLKLVFATLIRASDKWRRVSMSQYDLALLKNIRTMYGWKTVHGDDYISLKMAA